MTRTLQSRGACLCHVLSSLGLAAWLLLPASGASAANTNGGSATAQESRGGPVSGMPGPLGGLWLGQTPCADVASSLVAADLLRGVRLDPLTGGLLLEFLRGGMDASWERGGHVICDGGRGTAQEISLRISPSATADAVTSLNRTDTPRSNTLEATGTGRAEFDTNDFGAARVLVIGGEAGTDARLVYRTESYVERITFLAEHPEARASFADRINP